MIIKAKKPSRYTIISNVPIEDGRLSPDVLGLLTYLLSKPAKWEARSVELARRFHCSLPTIRRLLRELETAGHCRRGRKRDSQGKFAWYCDIYEEPQPEPSLKKPHMAKPSNGPATDGRSTPIGNTDPDPITDEIKTDRNSTVDLSTSIQSQSPETRRKPTAREQRYYAEQEKRPNSTQTMPEHIQGSIDSLLERFKQSPRAVGAKQNDVSSPTSDTYTPDERKPPVANAPQKDRK